MIRRIAAFALLACYGSVAVMGPELHELLGCEHHHHASGEATFSTTAPDQASVSKSHDGADDDDDQDCPICKLLSMAQDAPPAAPADWVSLVVVHRATFSIAAIAAAPHSSWQSRAPPLLAGLA